MNPMQSESSGTGAVSPVILAFNLDEDALKTLKGICDWLQLRLKSVPPESFALPLGALAGMPAAALGASLVGAPFFNDPMLVMCQLDEPRFNAFLGALRGSGIPAIPLKAVLTPTNANWSALQLHSELMREHAAIQRQRRKTDG